jgi:hypothetical protein
MAIYAKSDESNLAMFDAKRSCKNRAKEQFQTGKALMVSDWFVANLESVSQGQHCSIVMEVTWRSRADK